MGCFSIAWLAHLLIWLVVIGAVVALVRLLIPLVTGPLGPAGATIMQALYIVIWAIVAVALIILVFDLIGCLISSPALR